MATQRQPDCRNDFEIAVICALQTESDAVEAVFDEKWEYKFGKAPADPNTYTTGRIGQHCVVLVFLPGIGKANAASAAASLFSSFPDVKLALVVGICGGVPTDPTDMTKEILLGDIIISTGIIQYDFARQLPNKAVRKDSPEDNLSRPTKEIRSFLQKIGGIEGCRQLHNDTFLYLETMCQEKAHDQFKYPGRIEDKLYQPTYRHKHHNSTACDICVRCVSNDNDTCQHALESSCEQLGCNESHLAVRNRFMKRVETPGPQIHFGLVASGDLVMKSGSHRDEIARKENILAFEMEGAGVWDSFPTVIIKGVCDYADSHKNNNWQGYAAAAAAACMKAFLRQWVVADRVSKLEVIPRISNVSVRHGDPWRCETLLSCNPRSQEASFVETYDYVYFAIVVVIWNLQERLRKRRIVAYMLLVLHYLCLSPLSPLSWRCVKFEDALGRIQKVPFELCRNLHAFNNFLLDNFEGRPGWHKVRRSEYLIASGKFGGAIITPQQWLFTVQPGVLLTMIMRVASKEKRCPKCQKELRQAEIQCSACSQYYCLHLQMDTIPLNETEPNILSSTNRSAGPRTLEDTIGDEQDDTDMPYFKYTYYSGKISHPRPAIESPFLPQMETEIAIPNISYEGTDEDEGLTKIPLVRKKSGKLVRPALRPKSALRRRPSSMPGVPHFMKAVHFDSQLEQVRHFLQIDKPTVYAKKAQHQPLGTSSSLAVTEDIHFDSELAQVFFAT